MPHSIPKRQFSKAGRRLRIRFGATFPRRACSLLSCQAAIRWRGHSVSWGAAPDPTVDGARLRFGSPFFSGPPRCHSSTWALGNWLSGRPQIPALRRAWGACLGLGTLRGDFIYVVSRIASGFSRGEAEPQLGDVLPSGLAAHSCPTRFFCVCLLRRLFQNLSIPCISFIFGQLKTTYVLV